MSPSMRRRGLLALLVLLLVPVTATPVAADDEPTVRVLVERGGSVAATVDDLEDAGATEVTPLESIPWVTAEVPASAVDDLEDADAVDAVMLDRPNRVQLDETLPVIGVDALPAVLDGGSAAVAVLDTGVDADHPFLAGRVVAEACFTWDDCPNGHGRQVGDGAAEPCALTACDHGTHVAGIAAGAGTSSPARGVAPGAPIVAVQVFSVVGGEALAYNSDIVDALDWVATNADELDIAAVNLSLGSDATFPGNCANPAIEAMFAQLHAAGVAPVVAAGNRGETDEMSSPACVAGAISVAATDDGDDFPSFTNVSSVTTFAAPGVDVESSVPGGYEQKDGTSMAAPHVAGAFALLRDAAGLDVDASTDLLEQDAVLLDDTVRQDLPRIDVGAAVASLGITAPGNPTAVTASAGAQQAALSWTAPADTGGGRVLRYRVTASPADVGPQLVRSTSTTITGLTAGTAYTFTVSAITAGGESAASDPSAAVEPTAEPTRRRRSSGGGGGGGGGGGSRRTPPTATPPPSTSPAPQPQLPPLRPSAAVAAPGGVVTVKHGAATTLALPPWIPVAAASSAAQGAWVATPDGKVLALDGAPALGEVTTPLNAPIVGMASTTSGGGYWLLGRDGGIFTFGDAAFHGSTGGMRLNQPVVGLAPTPTGGGYWLLAADGGVFSFGDAGFHGSTGGTAVPQPVVGMASSATGRGYWLVGADGSVFAFGDAPYAGGGSGSRPVRALVPTPTGAGYWLLCADGAALPFGDAG